MPFKRPLAIASTISAVVISGALAAGAVGGLANDAPKAGEYGPVDLSKLGPNSRQGGADPSSSVDGATGVSSGPDIGAPSGATLITESNSSSSGGSGAAILKGSTGTSNTGAGPGNLPVNPSPGSGDPATTTTSFDDHGDDHGGENGGGHGSDDALDDDYKNLGA